VIKTSRQLKALIRNKSKGDSSKALYIMRSYGMERFLERLSVSKYKNHMALKGGILIASMIGLDKRSTMDIDATLIELSLDEESISKIVGEIISIKLEDGMDFNVKKSYQIMDESEYPGIRVELEAQIEETSIPFKLDFSVGDKITPEEVEYAYPLIFEERTIPLIAYNVESILAEKIETILSWGAANTRARDFYDIFILQFFKGDSIDYSILKEALIATVEYRNSQKVLEDAALILNEIEGSTKMENLWQDYQDKFDYASNLEWKEVVQSIRKLISSILEK